MYHIQTGFGNVSRLFLSKRFAGMIHLIYLSFAPLIFNNANTADQAEKTF